MITNYLITTLLLFCLIFIIRYVWLFFDRRRKPKTVMDRLLEEPKFREMKVLFDAMKELNKDGTDQDVIPEGFGEFGLEVTNPIPVNTIFGNTAYLARLRTPEGVKVRYERKGSTGAKNIQNPIDIYEIYNGDEMIATLYISPYHNKNSEKAPEGFKLA